MQIQEILVSALISTREQQHFFKKPPVYFYYKSAKISSRRKKIGGIRIFIERLQFASRRVNYDPVKQSPACFRVNWTSKSGRKIEKIWEYSLKYRYFLDSWNSNISQGFWIVYFDLWHKEPSFSLATCISCFPVFILPLSQKPAQRGAFKKCTLVSSSRSVHATFYFVWTTLAELVFALEIFSKKSWVKPVKISKSWSKIDCQSAFQTLSVFRTTK